MKLKFIRNEHEEYDQFLNASLCAAFEEKFEKYCIRLSDIYGVNLLNNESLVICVRDDTWKNKNSSCLKINSDNECYILINFTKHHHFEVLFHELCHTFQQISGLLNHSDKAGCIIWNGYTYNDYNQIPHAQRPWEIDAIKNTFNEWSRII
jgi:hypothetical protein